mmetsp:Transcript_76561/g.247821  ORF Transcript_76561/g.247821 Transcript_76561/m.247821 type:complete len:120 (+) Transcript_76561:1104-1463(+)
MLQDNSRGELRDTRLEAIDSLLEVPSKFKITDAALNEAVAEQQGCLGTFSLQLEPLADWARHSNQPSGLDPPTGDVKGMPFMNNKKVRAILRPVPKQDPETFGELAGPFLRRERERERE